MTDLKKVVCAGTIVFRIGNEGKAEFLLVKPNKSNEYGLPKGHQEPEESVEEAAVRETYEESGVVPSLLYELPPVFTKNPNEIKTLHCFIASQLNPEAPLRPQREEVEECTWFPIDNLPRVHKYQRPLFKQAIEMISKVLGQ